MNDAQQHGNNQRPCETANRFAAGHRSAENTIFRRSNVNSVTKQSCQIIYMYQVF